MTRLLVLCAALVVTGVTSHAQTLPTLTAPVNDFAGVVSPGAVQDLDRIIRTLHDTTGDTIVVATVTSMAPFGSIEEYALRLFEQAGIGARANDNGVLMLVAVDDRKVRIEVGYGLEEFITDGYAGDVIRTHLLPAFREGRYGPGLVAGAEVLAARIAQGRGATLPVVQPAVPERTAPGLGISPAAIRVLTIAILLVVLINWINERGGGSNVRRRGRRGHWSGWHGGIGGFGGGFGSGGGFSSGGFGGGFGGFGGGRSGGGGASGGW